MENARERGRQVAELLLELVVYHKDSKFCFCSFTLTLRQFSNLLLNVCLELLDGIANRSQSGLPCDGNHLSSLESFTSVVHLILIKGRISTTRYIAMLERTHNYENSATKQDLRSFRASTREIISLPPNNTREGYAQPLRPDDLFPDLLSGGPW